MRGRGGQGVQESSMWGRAARVWGGVFFCFVFRPSVRSRARAGGTTGAKEGREHLFPSCTKDLISHTKFCYFCNLCWVTQTYFLSLKPMWGTVKSKAQFQPLHHSVTTDNLPDFLSPFLHLPNGDNIPYACAWLVTGAQEMLAIGIPSR